MNDITTQQTDVSTLESTIEKKVEFVMKKMLAPLVKQLPSSILIEELVERDLNPKFSIKDVTTEVIGFNVADRSDKTDLLVNFDERQLVDELFSRDSKLFIKHLHPQQVDELLETILNKKMRDDSIRVVINFIKENFEITDIISYDDMLEQVEEEVLLEKILERVSTEDILRAVADSL